MSRNYAILLAVVLGAGLVVSGAVVADLGSEKASAAPSPNTADSSSIHVSASASASSQPDRVVVRLAVESTATNSSLARQRVAENVSSVRAALTSLGLSADQITTTDYNLYQDERRVPREGGVEQTQYRVSHVLVVETDDVESAGSVIDAAVANGATSIHDVRFTLDQSTREELRAEALSEAMADARSQAETLAASANVTIASVDRISTSGGHRVYREVAFAATATPAGADTDINYGPVSVTASVQVSYNAST